MSKYIIPGFIALIIVSCVKKKVPVYESVISGTEEGLKIILKILPTMIVILSAVSMFRASGALEYTVRLAAPFFEKINIPPELIPMIILRPVSGSGAMGILADTMQHMAPTAV